MVDVDEELKKAAKNLENKELEINEEPEKGKIPLYLLGFLIVLLLAAMASFGGYGFGSL